MNKKVSIIIPVYNTEKYLEKCLDSIINQEYRNLEIIIVNDGSTDNSMAIIKKYQKLDSRIKVFEQPNKGAGSARNKGLDNATGDYISFVDSDDYVSPLFIKKLVEAFKEDDLFSHCGIDKNGKDFGVTEEERKLFIRACVTNKLYNAKYLKDIRFTNHKYSEDLIFNYKLSFINDNGTKVNDILYYYNYNGDSLTNTWHDNYNEIFNQMDEIVNYRDIDSLSNERKERLEFLLIWYLIFGNFKRIGKNISKEYITKSLNYIEDLFPNWANNKYIDKYVWDVEKLHAIVRKDYDEIIRLYNE